MMSHLFMLCRCTANKPLQMLPARMMASKADPKYRTARVINLHDNKEHSFSPEPEDHRKRNAEMENLATLRPLLHTLFIPLLIGLSATLIYKYQDDLSPPTAGKN